MKLVKECTICSEPLEQVSSMQLSSTQRIVTYKCGHVFCETIDVSAKNGLRFESVDHTKHARPYQEEGIKFIIDSGFNCVIGDQMRLGKTPQALLALASDYVNRTPCLILVRSANLWQWMREYKVWTDSLPLGIYPINGSKSFIPPGFSAYIMSMDLLSNEGTCGSKTCKHSARMHDENDNCRKCDCKCFVDSADSMVEKLLAFGFKLVIVDEAHSFKNTDSKRSKALIRFLHEIAKEEIEQTWTFSCPFNHVAEEDNPYKVLGLEFKSSPEEIKKAFREKSFETHPDHGGTSDEFRKVKDAASVLSDPSKRSKYDKYKSGGAITWEEKVTISTNITEGYSTTSKSSKCPLCGAYVRQSAAINLTKKARKCGVIMLTGTPIKNRASEYFVPLNIVAPTIFTNKARFQTEWLDDTGKRIKNWKLDDFRRVIKPYVLRREKEDVFTDLPPINRMFTMIEVEDQSLKDLYNKTLDRMEAENGGRDNFKFFESIGDLAILRQICGLAKVTWAADYVKDCIEESDRDQKYAIGVHHHLVRDGLARSLADFGVLKLSGEDSPERKDWVMRHFETSRDRCLVLNMLAGGVGMDFHYVDNALILERMWSAADEEQFEFRFYNPDIEIMGKGRSANIEYVVAKGTIDEFFYDLVEEKRKIFGETIANHWSLDQDTDSFQSLMRRTLAGRLK